MSTDDDARDSPTNTKSQIIGKVDALDAFEMPEALIALPLEMSRLASVFTEVLRPLAQELASTFGPDTLLGDIAGVMNGGEESVEAGRRLSRKWFSRGRLFATQRWELLADLFLMRLEDKGPKTAWEELAIPSMMLAFNRIRKGDWEPTAREAGLSLFDCFFDILRREVRREIERDLLGGSTLDQKTGTELPIDEETENLQAESNEELEALENLMRSMDPEVLEILMVERGKDREVAHALGISQDALRARRHRLVKTLRKKLET
ncbi:MAG: hypothetical protein ABSF61_13515 [Anaerolineales bacterium]|jgi:hypothetical protein